VNKLILMAAVSPIATVLFAFIVLFVPLYPLFVVSTLFISMYTVITVIGRVLSAQRRRRF